MTALEGDQWWRRDWLGSLNPAGVGSAGNSPQAASAGEGRIFSYSVTSAAAAAELYSRIRRADDLLNGATTSAESVPDVVLPGSAFVVDVDAGSELDERGFRIPQEGTVPNPGQAVPPEDQQLPTPQPQPNPPQQPVPDSTVSDDRQQPGQTAPGVDVEKLDGYVAPETLELVPVLRPFYNADGTLKSREQLAAEGLIRDVMDLPSALTADEPGPVPLSGGGTVDIEVTGTATEEETKYTVDLSNGDHHEWTREGGLRPRLVDGNTVPVYDPNTVGLIPTTPTLPSFYSGIGPDGERVVVPVPVRPRRLVLPSDPNVAEIVRIRYTDGTYGLAAMDFLGRYLYSVDENWNRIEPTESDPFMDKSMFENTVSFGAGLLRPIVDSVKDTAALFGIGGPGAAEAWQDSIGGLGSLVGLGPAGGPGFVDSWKAVGKDFLGWDEWARGDWSYALGIVVSNVGTTIGTGGAALVPRINKAVNSIPDIDAPTTKNQAPDTVVENPDRTRTDPTPGQQEVGEAAQPKEQKPQPEAEPINNEPTPGTGNIHRSPDVGPIDPSPDRATDATNTQPSSPSAGAEAPVLSGPVNGIGEISPESNIPNGITEPRGKGGLTNAIAQYHYRPDPLVNASTRRREPDKVDRNAETPNRHADSEAVPQKRRDATHSPQSGDLAPETVVEAETTVVARAGSGGSGGRSFGSSTSGTGSGTGSRRARTSSSVGTPATARTSSSGGIDRPSAGKDRTSTRWRVKSQSNEGDNHRSSRRPVMNPDGSWTIFIERKPSWSKKDFRRKVEILKREADKGNLVRKPDSLQTRNGTPQTAARKRFRDHINKEYRAAVEKVNERYDSRMKVIKDRVQRDKLTHAAQWLKAEAKWARDRKLDRLRTKQMDHYIELQLFGKDEKGNLGPVEDISNHGLGLQIRDQLGSVKDYSIVRIEVLKW
ncbi:hypothetical protein [Nocardia sp. CC227C]|uniref:hypothetical protein n=1 Tax=Nocardia sp. CC227C TaxID=3044562 RepID=UPI00278BE26C|nr:hypothetical protein [Nocardia sp. CC227C]